MDPSSDQTENWTDILYCVTDIFSKQWPENCVCPHISTYIANRTKIKDVVDQLIN